MGSAGSAGSAATGTGGAAGAGGDAGLGGAPMGGAGAAGAGGSDAGAADVGAPEVGAEEPIVPDRSARTTAGCPAEEAEARVLFDIPRAGDVSDDFFRLPFPNDIRWRNGRLALGDFPRPLVFPGLEVIDRVVKAIQAEGLGYGPNPVVTFRLTRAARFDEAKGEAAAGAIRFVDLTAGAAEYGQVLPHRVTTLAPGRYLCPRHLVIQRESAAPLLPGHTYAVVVTRALTDLADQPFGRDVDFGVMLGARMPDGDERQHAWNAYAPLRRWLAEGALDRHAVVGAAVFTVADYNDPVAKLRAAVRATTAPVVKDLVRCGPGIASVCDDGRTQGCGSAADGAPFVEFQGRLEMPVFQQGTPPFETAGGGIRYGADGVPEVARREAVCFSLTVPKAGAGPNGFPLVIYGHGTGGHFRGPVESGLATELSVGQIDGGAQVPMATLSFDGVLHGARKGSSLRSTDELVYNVFNPTAARDNNLQAAADLFAFARALPMLVAVDRPLDRKNVGVYGHSQGGNAAAIAAGYEPDFGAVVLSGTGGGIATSLLEKQKPVSAATVLPLIIGESVTKAFHPALAMLQLYFDRADPLNHGRRIAAAPLAGTAPRHLLHVFGAKDSYAPVSTQLAFAVGAELPVLRPVIPLMTVGLDVLAGPVRSNYVTGIVRVTALEAQFSPGDYDGHFVSTLNPSARGMIQRFLGTYFRDATPAVD